MGGYISHIEVNGERIPLPDLAECFPPYREQVAYTHAEAAYMFNAIRLKNAANTSIADQVTYTIKEVYRRHGVWVRGE